MAGNHGGDDLGNFFSVMSAAVVGIAIAFLFKRRI